MSSLGWLCRFFLTAGACALAARVPVPSAVAATPYKIVNIARIMGTGGIDYVYADNDGRRLYVPRGNQILVFDLDTLKAAGAVTNSGGHGVAVDPKSHHGFSSQNPVTMFDSLTLKTIKTIPVQGHPDGILFEPATERVYVLSHDAPNVTVIDAKDGSLTGTMDLDGEPGQAVSDGNGHVYIDLEDRSEIAVVDAATLKCPARFSLAGNGAGPAGLGLDATNHILFAMCRNPATCVVLSADDGKVLTTLPIGFGADGGVFNPNTREAFSSQLDGTLTVLKENSPDSFTVEQTVQTMPLAKTCALDTRNNRIILITVEKVPPPEDVAEAVSNPAAPPPGAAQARASGRHRDPRMKRGGPGFLDIIVVGR